MKTFATILAASSLLALSAAAQSFTPTSKNIKIDKISPSVTLSPEYKIDKTTDKRSEYKKWLEVEVEFSVTDLPANVEVIDELTFEYIVDINGKLCIGEVTHVNIPKGKSLYSIMYMSPRSIDGLTGGKDLTPAALGNMWIKVKKQGAVLADKSLKTGVLPNKPQKAGLLIQKSETPFAPLWFDRYEAVKSSAR
jgi:hypothetical protein